MFVNQKIAKQCLSAIHSTCMMFFRVLRFVNDATHFKDNYQLYKFLPDFVMSREEDLHKPHSGEFV